MGIQEERNIATLLRWNHDVWGSGGAALAPQLLAPTYLRHDPRGVRAWTPEEYGAVVASRQQAGAALVRHDEIIARGNYVAIRWTGINAPADSPFAGGLQVYQFDDEARICAMWGGTRSRQAGLWPDDAEPGRWIIASAGELTAEEQRNERTRRIHLERRLVSDPSGLDELLVDPLPSHTPVADRRESIAEFAERIRGESTRYPAKQFVDHVHFVVGDRSVEVWGWRWDDTDAPVYNGAPLKSPWEFIEIWRYDRGRIAERWQVAAEPGVDWTAAPA
ncbi:MAG: hypothetical protein R3C39_13465 [Dehalococcoidia bacterium]